MKTEDKDYLETVYNRAISELTKLRDELRKHNYNRRSNDVNDLAEALDVNRTEFLES